MVGLRYHLFPNICEYIYYAYIKILHSQSTSIEVDWNPMELPTKKIKLCVVMPGHWSDRMGGAQYQAAKLIDVLIASEEFDIYYLTRNVDISFKPKGYKIIAIRKPFRVLRGLLFLDTLPLLKSLSEIKPDVIYTRIGCAYTGIAAFYAKHNRCKLVWHVSSDTNTTPQSLRFSRSMLSDFLDRKIFEYGVRNADHIIAQTKFQALQLRNNFGKNTAEIIANFHPLPTEKISKGKLIRVVWVANLKPLKQPEVFIRLANDLAFLTDVEFILIGAMQGSSGWKTKISRQIHSTGNIRYLGCVPQEQVNAVLAESHILVNTSKWEGFTNTFIQAWMRKVPVVSLNINPDNLFDDRQLGFFAGHYELLKEYTEALIRDSELRNTMGEFAYQYALKYHSENNAQRILSLFKQCTG